MNPDAVEILLVDDSPADVELTLRALRQNSLANRVHVAGDGVEALEFMLPADATQAPPTGYPKLILLDLKLPRIDGLEVLRRLKASEATRNIPIVILTSSRQEGDVVASYDLGANSFIVKPVDFQKFTEAVSSLGMYWLLLNKVPS